MIGSANTPSYGFENLALKGLQAQRQQAAEALRAGQGLAKPSSGELTAEQQRQVEQLQAIDRKVKAHEQAHVSVGGDLVRGRSFDYETGPDKRRYAVAGEVSIDTSPARTPEATIPKAEHIRATALAPADPSPQDHSVAAQASQMAMAARQEVAAKAAEERASADNPRSSAAIGAYQSAGGLELSLGFSAQA